MYHVVFSLAVVITGAFGALDIVIVVDSSTRIGFIDWELEKTVIINFLYATGSISSGQNRILGLVAYTDKIDIRSPLVDIQGSSKVDVVDTLNSLPYVTTPHGADLAAGLRAAKGLFGGCYDRKKVPNVVVVVTSYCNSVLNQLSVAASELKEVSNVVTFAMDPRVDKADGHVSPGEIDIIATDPGHQQHYMKYAETVALVEWIRDYKQTPDEDDSSTFCEVCPSFYQDRQYIVKKQHRIDESPGGVWEVDSSDNKDDENINGDDSRSQEKDDMQSPIKTLVFTPDNPFKDLAIHIETYKVEQLVITILRTDGSKKTWNMAFLLHGFLIKNSKKWNTVDKKTESSTYTTVEKIVISFKPSANAETAMYRNLIITGCEKAEV